MNRVFCLVIIFCSGVLFAETNSLSLPGRLFSTPQAELRLSNVESNTQPQTLLNDLTEPTRRSALFKSVSKNPEGTTNSEPQDSFKATSASGGLNGVSLQIYIRLEKGGYLTRPALPSEDRLDILVNTIFVPEVFKVQNFSVSSSITTAIKRRSLLPLLNPIFLDIRW